MLNQRPYIEQTLVSKNRENKQQRDVEINSFLEGRARMDPLLVRSDV